MKPTWDQTLANSSPVDEGLRENVLVKETRLMLRVHHVDSLPEVLLHLVHSQVIPLELVAEDWVFPDQIYRFAILVKVLLPSMKEQS